MGTTRKNPRVPATKVNIQKTLSALGLDGDPDAEPEGGRHQKPVQNLDAGEARPVEDLLELGEGNDAAGEGDGTDDAGGHGGHQEVKFWSPTGSNGL
jgi:hypothetical protein